VTVVVLVIDSFGIGALPDAADYGDLGANTALHLCRSRPGAKWPNLARLGLGNAAELLGFELPGCGAVAEPIADFGVLGQKSAGKDSTTGHWELADIVLDRPFAVFPKGPPSFPEELIGAIQDEAGVRFLGNYAASGTQIIDELGAEHLSSGNPICYTSADSVFQIAAHESIVSLERLYRICEIARSHCDAYQIARVIARPFTGSPGAFQRTAARRDFSMTPPEPNLLSRLQADGCRTVGVGKIGDIFADRHLDRVYKDKSNQECLTRLESVLDDHYPEDHRFVFVNLVETDMIYGHRRDVDGYFASVSDIDSSLPAILRRLGPEDSLIITADHGCDPTYAGTDHTREYVPLLSYRPGVVGSSLGIAKGHDEVAKTVYSHFSMGVAPRGEV
jgi:phosphopentomutase